ncbi:MAG: ribonuclease Y [Deltaproteobacteria bacterium]|nr:ribonuclease Y [Deltaproteobacteria bacterium]
MIYLVVGMATLVIGFIAGMIIETIRNQRRREGALKKAEDIISEAKREADNIIKNARLDIKELEIKSRTEFERETREKKEELVQIEKRLRQKEENLEKKVDFLDNREEELKRREKNITKREQMVAENEKRYSELLDQARSQLERIAGLSREEAKKELIQSLIDEAKLEAGKMIKQIEQEARDEAEKKAKEIIALAIQRYAGDYVAERTVTVIDLPNEDLKGRLIGREGRNIRAIEQATGVDLIIDDTPEAVVISSFDPIRREIARIAIEKLIADGRIHPARIEEIVAKTKMEVDNAMRQAGEQAVFDLGIHGMHPELVKLIGRLRYRYSYGQNQWKHSIEVGFLAGIMAAELGLNVKQARRAGLLHDIGKAVDHEMEGSHAIIGAELAKKYGESPKIVHAIKSHHEEEKPDSILDVIVQAADALSGARPGARHEVLETYIKRLEDMEKICAEFEGVEKAFAIQAGREIRVIVHNQKITDEQLPILAKDISKKIQETLAYPGQIKVVVIRESRAIEYAK